MFSAKGKKTIDVTRSLENGMNGVQIDIAKTVANDGWNATTLHLYSHIGTHMDAPFHFEVAEQTIDEISAERFISEAWLVNLSHLPAKALIEPLHLAGIEHKFKQGDSILLRTDWSKTFGTDVYRNDLPRISADLAHWMGEKGVNILGVEPPSVADVNNLPEVTEIHTILMQNDIVIVEGLVNLDQITAEKVTLIAMPLKIKNGDGAPARVIVLEEITE
ncbi:MAG: cyclase family protein [Cellulophaga sp.]|nr:cyclase family protein [Cellulophaga sp.]